MLPPSSGKYIRIPLPTNDSEFAQMRASVRSLDDEQRMAYNIGLDWVMGQRTSECTSDPPLIILHGGAGTGKSHVIDAMTISYDYFLRYKSNMSDTRFPTIIKVAPTGLAANGVDGQTLHQAFNLPWAEQYTHLSDKVLDEKRSDF